MFCNPLTPDLAQSYRDQFAVRFPHAAAISIGRADRAAHLVCRPAQVETTADPAVYLVRSDSNPLATYTVDTRAKTCTCPDHGKAGAAGVVCKHRLAVAFLTSFGQVAPQGSETADELWNQQLQAMAAINPLSDRRHVLESRHLVLDAVISNPRSPAAEITAAKAETRAIMTEARQLQAEIVKLEFACQKITNRYYEMIGARQA